MTLEELFRRINRVSDVLNRATPQPTLEEVEAVMNECFGDCSYGIGFEFEVDEVNVNLTDEEGRHWDLVIRRGMDHVKLVRTSMFV